MTRTIEEEFDFVCKAAGLVKLGISEKPTYLTADKSEGVELDGTTVRAFNNDTGERNYKDVPGSTLQAIVDAFKIPAPKGKENYKGSVAEGLADELERVRVAKNELKPQPKPAPTKDAMEKKYDEDRKERMEMKKMEEKKEEPKISEVVKETALARKTEFKTGTCEAVAVQYGIPSELANLFFMKMNEGLYIKNPGLLYLAGKKGYSRIEITDKYDDKTQEWSAECKIYPRLSKEIIEGIGKLDKEMQKHAFDFLTNPTNGTGRASKNNVKMSTMQAFLREMAQTRAQNRALRAFTGYGGTSAEELPEGQIEDAK